MLRSLQVGRALAALAVVAFHLSIGFSDPRIGKPTVFADYTGHGYLGVDFFFVLSGFIIFVAHREDLGRPERVGSYFRKRFIRVYPIYWILTAVTISGTILTGGSKSLPISVADIASAFTLIHFNGFSAPIGAAWTLYHEILFYLLFGMLILNQRAGAAVMVAWLGLIFFVFRYSPHGDWSFWHTLSSATNISFLCGFVACLLADRLRGIAAVLVALVGLPLLAAIYGLECSLGQVTIVQCGYSAAFMLMIAGLVGAERSGLVPSMPWLVLIGNASYTLYLAHESVASVLLKVAKRTHMLDRLDLRVTYCLVYVSTVLASVLFYLVVEAPLLRFLRKWRGLRASPVLTDGAER